MHQIVEDSHVNSTLRAMSLWTAEELSLSSFDNLASLNLMSSLVQSADGAFTVAGGFPTLRPRLAQLIRSAGGTILSKVSLESVSTSEALSEVKIVSRKEPLTCTGGLISGVGALCTLTRLIPLSVTSPALTTARGKLRQLQERRPKMFAVYSVRGTAASLRLSSSEYVDLSRDALSGVKIWSPSARDETWSERSVQRLCFPSPSSDLCQVP
jgi:hypothetical protein